MDLQTIIILQLVFRVIITIVCVNRARSLNRSPLNWGLFGFVLPLIALISIYLMKFKSVWPYSKNRIN
jgi:hypothetical protein